MTRMEFTHLSFQLAPEKTGSQTIFFAALALQNYLVPLPVEMLRDGQLDSFFSIYIKIPAIQLSYSIHTDITRVNNKTRPIVA